MPPAPLRDAPGPAVRGRRGRCSCAGCGSVWQRGREYCAVVQPVAGRLGIYPEQLAVSNFQRSKGPGQKLGGSLWFNAFCHSLHNCAKNGNPLSGAATACTTAQGPEPFRRKPRNRAGARPLPALAGREKARRPGSLFRRWAFDGFGKASALLVRRRAGRAAFVRDLVGLVRKLCCASLEFPRRFAAPCGDFAESAAKT